MSGTYNAQCAISFISHNTFASTVRRAASKKQSPPTIGELNKRNPIAAIPKISIHTCHKFIASSLPLDTGTTHRPCCNHREYSTARLTSSGGLPARPVSPVRRESIYHVQPTRRTRAPPRRWTGSAGGGWGRGSYS